MAPRHAAMRSSAGRGMPRGSEAARNPVMGAPSMTAVAALPRFSAPDCRTAGRNNTLATGSAGCSSLASTEIGPLCCAPPGGVGSADSYDVAGRGVGNGSVRVGSASGFCAPAACAAGSKSVVDGGGTGIAFALLRRISPAAASKFQELSSAFFACSFLCPIPPGAAGSDWQSGVSRHWVWRSGFSAGAGMSGMKSAARAVFRPSPASSAWAFCTPPAAGAPSCWRPFEFSMGAASRQTDSHCVAAPLESPSSWPVLMPATCGSVEGERASCMRRLGMGNAVTPRFQQNHCHFSSR